MDTPRSQIDRIKARALSLGFSIIGITDAQPLQEYSRYTEWIDQKSFAGMEYLASPYHLNVRKDPHLLFPEVQSIIVLGLSYSLHPLDRLNLTSNGLISGYAAGEDYHTRIPRMLKEFTDYLSDEFSGTVSCRIFTDSAPILERELACRAGLGWIGRNSCIISPEIGSAFLLAEVFIDQYLQADPSFLHDRCGNCNRCIKACPTGCIQNNRTIDARRCLSYHSIENRGLIPDEIMNQSGVWFFGCDICQMVCPWNAKLILQKTASIKDLSLDREKLFEVLSMTDEELSNRFGKTALARTRRKGLIRNALICLGNIGAVESKAVIHSFLERTSDPDLQQTVRWALNQMDK